MTFDRKNADALATVGGRIRAARLASGLSTDAVATALKVSRPAVSTWEADKIEHIPERRIEEFCRLTQVPVEWVINRQGAEPHFAKGILKRLDDWARTRRQYPRTREEVTLAPAPPAPPSDETREEVREIKGVPHAPAAHFKSAPRAKWAIPREVLTLGFNCDPDNAIIQRVPVGFVAADGTQVSRGDYVLIDGTRTIIDEPGTYYVEMAGEIRRAFTRVDESTGKLITTPDNSEEPLPADTTALGRVMAIFHSV